MLVQNFSAGFLTSAIDQSATTITVNPGHSLPTVVGGVFTATIWNSTGFASPAQDPLAEIVWGQYFSPSTYTIVRGMEGTAPISHAAGSLIALYITAGVLTLPYVKVSETEPSGTAGGTNSTGSWIARVLNTKDSDTSNIASLSSNQVTLPAGTYLINASAPFVSTGHTQIRLYDITHSTSLLIGQSSWEYNSVDYVGFAFLRGLFTLSSTSALAIQYQAQNVSTTNGLGEPNSFGTEVYTVAEFTMVNT